MDGRSCIKTLWVGGQGTGSCLGSGPTLQTLVCVLPPGAGKNLPITVQIKGQISPPAPSNFSYNLPTVTK